MRQLLAQSENFKIFSAYEEAQLEGRAIEGHIVVGVFYGHVECACIDKNELWCISCGDGLVLYQLKQPFEEYRLNHKTSQWIELWRSKKGWSPEAIYQIEDSVVRLVIDVFSEEKGVYDLDTKTLEIVKRV